MDFKFLHYLHLALVDVDLAVDPREPRLALAVVGVDGVDALAAVLAGVAEALVKVVVAVVAGEAWAAVALVAAHRVLADAIVAEVRLGLALVDVLLAVLARPALHALAPVLEMG